jgi:hypothetical protein
MRGARTRKASEIKSEHDADMGMARFTGALATALTVNKRELDRRVKEAKLRRGIADTRTEDLAPGRAGADGPVGMSLTRQSQIRNCLLYPAPRNLTTV